MTSARPRASAPPAQRRDQLLLVARRIFADKGFQATTMDDIAKEAGFTKPILYQYFDSKSSCTARSSIRPLRSS